MKSAAAAAKTPSRLASHRKLPAAVCCLHKQQPRTHSRPAQAFDLQGLGEVSEQVSVRQLSFPLPLVFVSTLLTAWFSLAAVR